ncbi:uncharacterized protein N7469_002073 [Penicillium citrinum]|uniref:Uncharacterized protein n=1 Tax=Penicillium citrinum TaxID=5077 RepID=A0A9W9P9U4_PENCI|nr:uncharacterized protein N7469_002073 [Penicillium citrinum]KAJ5240482.1 hypothetical protein N7469_002073 [Penicillium citrinum]
MPIYSIKTVAQNPDLEDYAGQQRAQETEYKLSAFLSALGQVDGNKIRSQLHLLQPVPSPRPRFPAQELILEIDGPIDSPELQCQLNKTWNDVKNLTGITVENKETGAAATLSF